MKLFKQEEYPMSLMLSLSMANRVIFIRAQKKVKTYMLKTYDNLLEFVVLITYDDNLKDQA
jgi:hypothetical protein